MTTTDQRRALALRIAKTIQRDPASIVASLRARLGTSFRFNRSQKRDDHGRWTDGGPSVPNMPNGPSYGGGGSSGEYDDEDIFIEEPKGPPHFKPGMPSKHVDELDRQAREALHPKGKPFDSGLTKQEKDDIAEFTRLDIKLNNSYLTAEESDRYDELRRKVEGPDISN